MSLSTLFRNPGLRRLGLMLAVLGPASVVPFVTIGSAVAAPLPPVGPKAGTGAPVRIVCVERVWCAIAARIGGPDVGIRSILNAPGIDPHDYAPSPAVARALADADLVVLNGAGFDAWADALVPEAAHAVRVGALPGIPQGETHLFFDPRAAALFGQAVTRRLIALRPDDRQAIAARGAAFADDVRGVDAAIARARAHTDGAMVASLEPVGAPLLRALGFRDVAGAYGRAAMNGATPAPEIAAALEREIDTRAIRVLVVNVAFDTPTTRRYAAAARDHGETVIALSEVLPEGKDWASWMRETIDALARAAGRP